MEGTCLAVITARGGSKRIPRKNIKLFCGKPIIEYSIEAALDSGVFQEVMVSTDDEEIARIAKNAGAMVPFLRSKENSGDMAMTHEVLIEVLRQYQEQGIQFDKVCCIYPTAPFLTAEKLQESMEKLEQAQADGVVPVVRYSFPPQRCVVIRDGRLTPKWPENMAKRSQDLEPFYHDCGQFYCLNVASFKKQKAIWMENVVPFVQDESSVQDIDTPEDWKIAEMKYRLWKTDMEG